MFPRAFRRHCRSDSTLLRPERLIQSLIMIVLFGSGIAEPAHAANPSTKRRIQALWVANGTNVLEFAPDQIGKGTRNVQPGVTLSSPAFASTQGVVFDKAGNLWVIDGGEATPPALEMFTPTQLESLKKKKTDQPLPKVQITSDAFVFPQQAVFDTAGNLWVSDNGANAVFVFAAAQLTTTATVTPSVTITATPSFDGPLGLAFDGSGNLWIANNGTTTIFEFNQTALPAVGAGAVSLTPSVILSDDGNGSIQGPWALIFDTTGNLWSSNANAPSTVVEFAKSDLSSTGSPTPAVTVSPTNVGKKSQIPSLNSPNGISLDNTGGLGVANSAAVFSVARFANSQLINGSPVPNALISGNKTGLGAPAGDNFEPIVKVSNGSLTDAATADLAQSATKPATPSNIINAQLFRRRRTPTPTPTATPTPSRSPTPTPAPTPTPTPSPSPTSSPSPSSPLTGHLLFGHYHLPYCVATNGCASTEAGLQAGYTLDIQNAIALGFNGFVLNGGLYTSPYPTKIQAFYAAADAYNSAHGTNFKLMVSPDMSGGSSDWSQSQLVSLLNTYCSDPAQFTYQGKCVLSAWQANTGYPAATWRSMFAASNVGASGVFFVPELSLGQPLSTSVINTWKPYIDGFWAIECCQTTPIGNAAGQTLANSLIDHTNIRGAGNGYNGFPLIYMGTSQTHYWESASGYLQYSETQGTIGIQNEWNQIINTTQPDWVEAFTYSDLGESWQSPFTGNTQLPGNAASPQGGVAALQAYYAHWWHSGAQPAIHTDQLYYAYRLSPIAMSCTGHQRGNLAGGIAPVDDIYLTTLLSPGNAATLTVDTNGTISTYSVPAGITNTAVPFAVGATQTFKLTRNGTTEISLSGPPITNSGGTCNYVSATGVGYSNGYVYPPYAAGALTLAP